MFSKKIFRLLLAAFLVSHTVLSQEVVKTMTYNLLNFPSAPPSTRTEIFQDILNEYMPDLLMVCELESELGGDMILNETLLPLNPNFARSVFVPIQSDPGTDNPLQQMVFYDTRKLTLTNEEYYKTQVRDLNRFTFLLNTQEQDTDPVFLEVFVAHLKSSTGTANNQARLAMIEVLMDALENVHDPNEVHAPIEPDSYVLFVGDMNFYTSSEPGYQKLRNDDQSSLRSFVDVLNPDNVLQSWTGNNPDWHIMHTQCTRVQQFGGYGASAGMDDRFDFVFFTENLFDNPELEYVVGSYVALGNNGNCHDLDIDDPACDGDYSQMLRNNLWLMSDHLPVVMELQTNQNFLHTPQPEQADPIAFPHGNMPTHTLVLAVDAAFVNEVSFTVYNTLGQTVLRIPNNASPTYHLNLSGLTEGVYYLQTQHSGLGGQTYTFVKRP